MESRSKPGTSESKDFRAAAQRIKPSRPMCVRSKTIGTTLVYKFDTENISKTGLLLNYPTEMKVPYRENTILELTIDTESNNLPTPIQCIGKVVRRSLANQRDDVFQIGISIVQIDAESQSVWENQVEGMR